MPYRHTKPWRTLRCFWDAACSTVYHDGIEHAGYMAFLSLLSLFPFLVLLMTLAGMVGTQQIGVEFTAILLEHLPMQVASALRPRIDEIVSGPPQGLLTIAILGSIWTASSTVEGLRTILNRAYRVNTPPAYPLRRMMSIVQLLIIIAVVLCVMLAWVFAPLLLTNVGYELQPHNWFGDYWREMSVALTMLILLGVVSVVYYVLPNIRQRWLQTLPGASSVVVLWMLAAAAFTSYIQDFDQVNLIYGSLGGLIGALLFFYIVHVILIFGAELNYYLERAMGHRFQKKDDRTDPRQRELFKHNKE